ncbi:hypothetical protein ACHAXS_012701 [Conticribra weissflogii]
MGNPKSDISLVPLQKTLDSLNEIRSNLFPFLKFLDEGTCKSGQSRMSGNKRRFRGGDDMGSEITGVSKVLDIHRRAEAEAAVALAIGTMRYMGARLKGLDRGRKKGDPLRVELDKIRGTLVTLRKIEFEGEGGSGKNSEVGKAKSEITVSSQTYNYNGEEKHKLVNTSASQIMIESALGNNNEKSSDGEESTPRRKKSRR